VSSKRAMGEPTMEAAVEAAWVSMAKDRTLRDLLPDTWAYLDELLRRAAIERRRLGL